MVPLPNCVIPTYDNFTPTKIIGKAGKPPASQEKIAYLRSAADGEDIATIYLANADGSEPTEILPPDGPAENPDFLGIIGFRWSKEAQIFILITYETIGDNSYPQPNFYLIESELPALQDISRASPNHL
jgi:hypothetical protein